MKRVQTTQGSQTGSWVSMTANLVPPFVPSPEPWRFDVFGRFIMAVNPLEGTTSGTTNDLMSLLGQDFVRMPHNPPRSTIVQSTQFGIFLVDADQGEQLWFSINGPDVDWEHYSIEKEIGFIFIEATPYPISAAQKLRDGIAIYKQRSVYGGTFIGPPFFWQFQLLTEEAGTFCQESVVNLADFHLFLGPDDFYQTDGYTVSRIPNRLREWFFARFDQHHSANVRARYDRNVGVAFWHYPSINAVPAGSLDEWVAYNIRTGRWTRGALPVENVLNPDYQKLPVQTYAELERQYPRYRDIGHVTYNSLAVTGTFQPVPALFLQDHTLYGFMGASKGGFLQHQFGDSSRYTQINQVRPRFAKWPKSEHARLFTKRHHVMGRPIPETEPSQLFTAGIDAQAIAVKPVPSTEGLNAPLTIDGAFNVIQSSRVHQLKYEFDSDTEIIGVEIDAIPAGTT